MDSPTNAPGTGAPASAPAAPQELGSAPAPTVDPTALANLQRSLQSLRTLFQVTLIAVIVVTAAGSVVLLQRVRQVRREMAALTRTVAEFDRVGQPQLEAFLNRLKDFARANPDFLPIFNKYVPPAKTNTTEAIGPASLAVPPAVGGAAKAPAAPTKSR
jgi:hypothetical protein